MKVSMVKNAEAFAHKLLGRLQHMERQVRDMLLFVRKRIAPE